MGNREGYVYILTSPNSDCITIGGTDYPPLKRIKEINLSEPYKSLGPWSLADFPQVSDWKNVEQYCSPKNSPQQPIRFATRR
jgi:hypothetical protein